MTPVKRRFGDTTSDKPRCGAKLRHGGTCKQYPITGRNRCRLHGGATPVAGPTHPNWKHGRRSKLFSHLPSKLRASFEASITDPDLLSVRSELALVDSRLHELLDRLNSGETHDRMVKLSTTIHQLQSATNAPDPSLPAIKAIADRARALIDVSFGEDSVWGKIQDTISSRISLTETERKIAEMKQANVAADRLQILLHQVLASVRQHVINLPGGDTAISGVAVDIFNMMGLSPLMEDREKMN